MALKPLLLVCLSIAGIAVAAPATYQYTGVTSSTMTVNNGTNSGTIPSGTPFTGTVTFDEAQTVTPVAFSGGTKSVFTFTSMTLTMSGSTLTWGPGNIYMYDNLTSTSGGYPTGDSLYFNINGVAPTGTINGASFNWIFFALLDSTGTGLTAGSLPSALSLANFKSSFIEFNYGTLGTPYGAGNTSTIQFVSTLAKTTGGPTINTTSLPAGVVGVNYSAPISVSAPNNDPVTVTVNGLPNGLSYANGAIAGVPLSVGTWPVDISATDTVTNLSTTRTLSLTVNASAISFTPSLPAGIAGAPYSATFAAATGGTGTFTYTATGLPSGLTLTDRTVAGTPAAAGTYPVTLKATDTSGASASATVNLAINAATCSGKDAVISAYVARTPGYIVINGGLNLLDHLWTTNLNSSNTVFLGGLVNWYQTGLIVDYQGTTDPSSCILTNLTVRPAVTISTASLPDGKAGVAYTAPVSISWGVAPYAVTVSGLPAGLSYSNGYITGKPTVSGPFSVTISVVDAVGASATKVLSLLIAPGYTIVDESKGKITAIGPDYLMAGTKKLIWDSSTIIIVNTPSGVRSVIDSFVKVGMKVQWKGFRDSASNTVLCWKLEVN